MRLAYPRLLRLSVKSYSGNGGACEYAGKCTRNTASLSVGLVFRMLFFPNKYI